MYFGIVSIYLLNKYFIIDFMISGLILARGMPSIVAQGLLLIIVIGFCSLIIDITKAITKSIKNDSQNRKIQRQKEWEESVSKGLGFTKLDEKLRTFSSPRQSTYSIVLKIRGCFATETAYNKGEAITTHPILFNVKKIETSKESFTPKVVFLKRENENGKIRISEIENNIYTWWILQIEGNNFDSNLLEFISYDDYEVYDVCTPFILTNVIYNGKRYPIYRIEKESDVSGYESSAALENWISST